MTNQNITIYKKRTSVIAGEADTLVIKNETDLKMAVQYLLEIKHISKMIAEEKEKFTKPATAILTRAREIFAPVEKSYNMSEMLLKAKILDFNMEQEKKAEKKIEKLEQDVISGKTDIVKASEKMEILTPASTVETDSGKIQYRLIKKVIISNLSLLPRKYLLPNNSLIRSDVLKGNKIPGVELKEEKIVAGLKT